MERIKQFIERCRHEPVDNLEIYTEFVKMLQWPKKNTYPHKSAFHKLGIRAIVFSDLHGTLTRPKLESFLFEHANYDVCFILGDLSDEEFALILEYVPYWKVFGVPGNHDSISLFERVGVGSQNLHGKSLEVKPGLFAAGIGGSFSYRKVDDFRIVHQLESLELAVDMIENQPPAQILISHDTCFFKREIDVGHTGLLGNTMYLAHPSTPLIYHFHGHVHHNCRNTYVNNVIEHSVFGMRYLEL